MTNRETAELKARSITHARIKRLRRQIRWDAIKDRVNILRRKSYEIDIVLEA